MAKDNVKNKLTSIAVKFFFLFFASSVIGGLLGKFIDKKFDIAPYGSLIVFFLFYILNWVIIWRVYKHFQAVPEADEEDSSNANVSEDKNNSN